MKKGLVLVIVLALLVGVAGLASAQDMVITPKVVGRALVGYLYLPNFNTKDHPNFELFTLKPGAFYGNFRWFQFRLITDVTLSRDFKLQLASQFEAMDGKAVPFANLILTYDPGFAKVTFAAKGQDVGMGSMDEPLLRLNVARRLEKDGEPPIYKHGDQWAKQLTTELRYDWGRAVAVLSLESSKEIFADFVGGFAEFELGNGKFGVGYHNEMTDPMYSKKVPKGYIALAADYRVTPDLRVQLDYSANNHGGEGYKAYWRMINELDVYPGTPFLIKNQINSVTTYSDFRLGARLLQAFNESTKKSIGWKYWLDGSYKFAPYTVGVDYRNWAYKTEKGNYMAEFYVKHDLTDSYRDFVKAFYRTDGCCGVVLDITLY